MVGVPRSAPTSKSLIISTSGLQAFKRCRKSYELGYLRMLDPIGGSPAATAGSNLHAMLADYAYQRRGTKNPNQVPDDPAMKAVVDSYIRLKGSADFDRMGELLVIEEPIFVEIAVPRRYLDLLAHTEFCIQGHHIPSIFVRMTFDLCYKRKSNGNIVLRDYKSFEKMQTHDYDNDFQSRFYIAGAMQLFETDAVEFEFENIRRVPPGTPNSKGVWTPDECYITQPLGVSIAEAKKVWLEAQFTVGEVLLAMAIGDPSVWYREDLKVGPHSCSSCFFKTLCKADFHGNLDEQMISELTNPRKPLWEPI